MLINTVVVWASLRKLKNTSYDQHIEDFPTHLQNSIRLMKIWKSLGTLGWSPTTGSDNDTCSFSRGEAGASVVEVLAVAGISSTYWMMELKDTEQFSTHSPLYRYQKRSSSILDDKLNSLYRVTINVKNCIRWLKTFTGYSEFHAKAIIRKQAKNTWCHTACQWRCYG